ncbi:MAG: hypothetical protein V7785_14470 [Bermanella sp.]
MNNILNFAPLILCLIFSQSVVAEYLSVLVGYQQSEHSYLTDTSDQKGNIYGASLDTLLWRRKSVGWLARGPKAEIRQATGFLAISSQIPVYQWHKHQGTWLEINWSKQQFQTQLDEAQTFLGNDDSSTSLGSGSIINTEHQLQRLQFYWYESAKQIGALNMFGINYTQETTPAASVISSTTATLFDGKFSGMGLVFGRMKDNRGLNFQWRFNMAKLESNFSNDVTQHQTLASAESSVFRAALMLRWHYRYYLVPYWYLVPNLQYNFNVIMQSHSQPQQIEHEVFTYSNLQTWVSLRRYF